jgi:hypothetical protein
MADKFPKTRREFVQLARSSDQVVNIEEGGRHTVIRFKDGTHVAIHRHAGDIPKGTRYAIIKAFKAAGVLLFILFLVWFNSPWIFLP